jgi:hypothetical protein
VLTGLYDKFPGLAPFDVETCALAEDADATPRNRAAKIVLRTMILLHWFGAILPGTMALKGKAAEHSNWSEDVKPSFESGSQ